jgi:hypothetical protein
MRMVKGGVCLIGVVCALQGAVVFAQGTAPSMTISATEQAARDADRLRILRDELAREARLLEDQTKRKAERLAANDLRGVEESEQALERHTQNMQSLRREIDVALQAAAGGARARPVAGAARRPATPTATLVAGNEGAPWWDVYGRRPASKVQPASATADDAAKPQPVPVSGTAR